MGTVLEVDKAFVGCLKGGKEWERYWFRGNGYMIVSWMMTDLAGRSCRG